MPKHQHEIRDAIHVFVRVNTDEALAAIEEVDELAEEFTNEYA